MIESIYQDPCPILRVSCARNENSLCIHYPLPGEEFIIQISALYIIILGSGKKSPFPINQEGGLLSKKLKLLP
jgi:hypothetical protein